MRRSARAFSVPWIRRRAGVSASIVQVSAGLLSREQHVLIANSEGLYTGDTRVYTRLLCSAVASDGQGEPDRHAQPRCADGL